MLSFLAFTFYHMLTIIRYIEIYFMIALLASVLVKGFRKMEVLFHTFYRNFGRAEENRWLYRRLRYIEVR